MGEAGAILQDCLPIKALPMPAAYSASASGPSTLRASLDSVAERARLVVESAGDALRDCLPVKRDPSIAVPAAGLQIARPGLGERFSAVVAMARSAAEEGRAIFLDCLPVKRVVTLPAPLPARSRSRPLRRIAIAAPRLPYSADERQAIAFLFLPFLLVISALIISQAARRGHALVEIAKAPHVLEQSAPAVKATTALVPLAAEAPIAAVKAPEEIASAGAVPPPVSTVPPPQIAMLEVPGEQAIGREEPGDRGICVKTASLSGAGHPAPASFAPTPEAFGIRLAQAARAQVDGFVIYDDKYRSISYPMGDVPSLFGVCTDVVVRAYRALGLDLQQLVQQARSGSGDRSIDHRRTEVLRRFFATRGTSLPVSSFAEDYLPGDIVTYYRPQNSRTRSHIAIVSDLIAPSGRPMIVHNRGWGPELEDALFVDEITGHYRYYGPVQKNYIEKAEAVGGNAKAPSFAFTGQPGDRQ